jgi:hypothetical protein
VESRDAEIFVTIPCILILKCLEKDDKGICKNFLPDMYSNEEVLGQKYKELLQEFDKSKTLCEGLTEFDFYNFFEVQILEVEKE